MALPQDLHTKNTRATFCIHNITKALHSQ